MVIDEHKIRRQERPSWCPKLDCLFKRRVMDSICGGELPEPILHAGDLNTFRICLNDDEVADVPVLPILINKGDLNWFRWVLDALDGRHTDFGDD